MAETVKKKVGRPKTRPEGYYYGNIAFRLSDADHARLDEFAARHGVSAALAAKMIVLRTLEIFSGTRRRDEATG